VAAIVTHSPPAALAAKAATSTIPIVFSSGVDPVKVGLVAGFDRPGGNVTGVNFLSANLGGKRLDLLLKIVPKATTVGLLSGAREFPGAERLSPIFNEQRAEIFKEQSSGVLADRTFACRS
jgi:putative ABC transport system substrate-binding protein